MGKRKRNNKEKRLKAQHRILKAKGRKDWREFKAENPQLAAERLMLLQHFKSI